MLIHEAGKQARLTKKAIEYYTMQGLIAPRISENGYREYSARDVEKLRKISVLRKLGISAEEIGKILGDTTNAGFQAIAVKKELEFRRNAIKKEILVELSGGKPYEEIEAELESLECEKTITDRLLEAFPGYYGRFIAMHFAGFLNEPIKTREQQEAYETILNFLDNLPPLEIPKELQEYVIEGTKHLGTREISQILAETQKSIREPEDFLARSHDMLREYQAFQKSEEYRNSPACRLMELMKEFNRSNGYQEVFLPAMKRLSPSYADYCRQMERTNQILLEKYPELGKPKG